MRSSRSTFDPHINHAATAARLAGARDVAFQNHPHPHIGASMSALAAEAGEPAEMFKHSMSGGVHVQEAAASAGALDQACTSVADALELEHEESGRNHQRFDQHAQVNSKSLLYRRRCEYL
jgi:hypothetical protein